MEELTAEDIKGVYYSLSIMDYPKGVFRVVFMSRDTFKYTEI